MEQRAQRVGEVKVSLIVVFFCGRHVRGAGLLRKALQYLVDFFVHPLDALPDAFVEGVPCLKVEYAALVVPSGQVGDDLAPALVLDLGGEEVEERLGRALATDDRLHHQRPALPVDVAQDVVQAYVHLDQLVVHALGGAAGLDDELVAGAAQVAQVEDFGGRDEGGAQEPVGVEAADPHAVGAVALRAALDVLHVARVDKAGVEAGVEQGQVRREPVDAGGLHGDGGDPLFLEMPDKLPQPLGVGGEGDHLRSDAVPEGAGACPDGVLVQVKPRAMGVDDFQFFGKPDGLRLCGLYVGVSGHLSDGGRGLGDCSKGS